jgi:hypothetical protein
MKYRLKIALTGISGRRQKGNLISRKKEGT